MKQNRPMTRRSPGVCSTTEITKEFLLLAAFCGLALAVLHYKYRKEPCECKVKKKKNRQSPADDLVACWLCRHQQAEFFFESAFGHDLDEVVLHVFHVGAFAADAPGGFGVGVIAFAAEFVHDVEPVECLGVACGKALFESD